MNISCFFVFACNDLTQVVTYSPAGQYLCSIFQRQIDTGHACRVAGILSKINLYSDPLGRKTLGHLSFYKDIGPLGHGLQLGHLESSEAPPARIPYVAR